MKHRKYILSIVTLAMISLFITGCKEFQPEIDVDGYVAYLDLGEEQEKALRPELTELKTIIDDFYQTNYFSKSESDKETLYSAKMELLKKVTPKFEIISRSLEDTQKERWENTETYYVFKKFREDVTDELIENFAMAYRREIQTGMVSGNTHYDTARDYIDNLTIYFGVPSYPFYKGDFKGSIKGRRNRGFPIGIQATIIPEELKKIEYKLSESDFDVSSNTEYLEIRTILNSMFHPNYVDIENWVVFLEYDDGRYIDPAKIVKRDKEWFSERELLFSDRIPEFLRPQRNTGKSEIVGSGFANRKMMGRGMQNINLNRSIKRQNLIKQHVSYYQLLFPVTKDLKNILVRANGPVKLVFMREIGSELKAEGIWEFR